MFSSSWKPERPILKRDNDSLSGVISAKYLVLVLKVVERWRKCLISNESQRDDDSDCGTAECARSDTFSMLKSLVWKIDYFALFIGWSEEFKSTEKAFTKFLKAFKLQSLEPSLKSNSLLYFA